MYRGVVGRHCGCCRECVIRGAVGKEKIYPVNGRCRSTHIAPCNEFKGGRDSPNCRCRSTGIEPQHEFGGGKDSREDGCEKGFSHQRQR